MVVTCAKVYVKILSPTNDLLEDRILCVRMQGNSRDGIQTAMDLMRKCKSVEMSSVFQKEICGVLDEGLKNNVLKRLKIFYEIFSKYQKKKNICSFFFWTFRHRLD